MYVLNSPAKGFGWGGNLTIETEDCFVRNEYGLLVGTLPPVKEETNICAVTLEVSQ